MEEIADRKSLHVFQDGRSFQLFFFFTFGYPENRENKGVSSKPEPAREPVLYFVISLVFRLENP